VTSDSTRARARILDHGRFLVDYQAPNSMEHEVAVLIDLTKHWGLWEDIQDVLVSRSRRYEKRIALDKVKAGLIKSGKLPRE